MRRHMKRCCPEFLPERLAPQSEAKQAMRREACGDDWISEEEVREAALRSIEEVKDPQLRRVLELRFGMDRGGGRRTPAEVAEALGGKHRNNPQAAQTLIRNALRSIPLVADDPTDLQVLFEDDDLLAVCKPPFLRSTPVHRFVGKSLTNQLVGYVQRRCANGAGQAEAPLLLHRLDQTTSGVVLCAKTKAAAGYLHGRWHGQECKKEYLALARLRPGSMLTGRVGESLLVDEPIGRDVHSADPVRRAVNREDGQSAATRLEVLTASDSTSMLLLACTLEESGRTHQIRVHAAHAGAPLLGDRMYSGEEDAMERGQAAAGAVAPAAGGDEEDVAEEAEEGARAEEAAENSSALTPARVALHAWRLRVPHPRTQEQLIIEAPLPEDLRRCMEAHGLEWCGVRGGGL